MREQTSDFLPIAAFVLMAFFVIVIVCAGIGVNNWGSVDAEEIGCDAVRKLYSFNSVQELDANVNELGKFCTPEVFMDLTVDNEERLLGTYLRFLNQPTDVVIEQATQDYVIYRLVNDYVDEGERYVFFFHVAKNGIIDSAREAKLNDFIPAD